MRYCNLELRGLTSTIKQLAGRHVLGRVGRGVDLIKAYVRGVTKVP
jgi:hypothetical protein